MRSLREDDSHQPSLATHGEAEMTAAERDFDTHPYSADEERVAKFFFDRGVGGGSDPIGALLAGYTYLVEQRKAAIDASAPAGEVTRARTELK